LVPVLNRVFRELFMFMLLEMVVHHLPAVQVGRESGGSNTREPSRGASVVLLVQRRE
jgi:hypothetical protein